MLKNIVLIGMPGAGKSTIGVLLAKTLCVSFVDTDLIIQEKEQRLLQDIIKTEGISGFLVIEENIIKNLVLKRSVIATGGSVVYCHGGMKKLILNSIIVYLKLDYEEIEKRIENIKTRGIVIEAGKTLKDLYNERVPLYEKYAYITIDCNGKNMESIVEEIKLRVLEMVL